MDESYKEYAPAVLRIGIALLLLWFGLTNVFAPNKLLGYLPPWFSALIPIAPLTFMMLNGIFEMIIGLALLLGFLTRLAAIFAALHILGIAVSLGYNDIAVRDIGLAIAAFAVFLNGKDKLCLDNKLFG